MAQWSDTNKPVQGGLFINLITIAKSAVSAGVRGVVAIPVKANWGPVGKVVEVTSETDLISKFGSDATGSYTAYTSGRLALLGKPKSLLLYRMADATASVASLTLKDTAGTPANIFKVDTLYPTARSFNATIRTNLSDSNKQDFLLYEGTDLKFTVTVTKGATVVDDMVAAINGVSGDKLVVATKIASGNATIASVTNSALTGGNAGASSVTNSDYLTALAKFEGYNFDTMTLDGATSSSLQTSAVAWVARVRSEGKLITGVFGGSATDDQTPATANTRSVGFNSESIINVGVSAVLDGVTYSSAQVACYIAGLMVGQALNESLSFASTPFTDVTPRLSNGEIVSALNAGTLVMFHDVDANSGAERVVIQRAYNTLTSYATGQSYINRKIKLMRISDFIQTALSDLAKTSYIGKVLGNEDGRATIIAGFKQFFETLESGQVLEEGSSVVNIDGDRQATASSDQVYFKYTTSPVDTVEQIFGSGTLV
jgi:hypothetical protein